MATATARHILVDSEQVCNDLKTQIQNGDTTFEEAAQSYSECPSGNEGGNSRFIWSRCYGTRI